MSEDAVQPQVRPLIAEHIDSVVQVEILTLLYAQSAKPWTPDDVGAELRIDAAWAATQFDNLCSRGLITCDDPAPPPSANRRYRFARKPRTSISPYEA